MKRLCGMNQWFLFAIIAIFPVAVIIRGIQQNFILRGIYNFRKELKHTKVKSRPPKIEPKDATFLGVAPNKRPVLVRDSMKHMLVAGTTGAGKTVALSNFIKCAVEKDYPLLVIDGKGDTGAGSLYDICKRFKGNKKLYVINLNNPEKSDKYNPFHATNPTIIKDMLINMSEWSEDHYKLNTERYLQRVATVLSQFNTEISLKTIVKCMDIDTFKRASVELLKKQAISKQQHIDNMSLAETSGQVASGAVARFSNIAESHLGQIFSSKGTDIYSALKENAIILFVLNPLLYPEISPAIGKLALIDAKKAVANFYEKNNRRVFFILDEIASYASLSLLDLVNKARSANITNILATQSISDLDAVSSEFKEQIIEYCNNYLVMRQNSATSAETWSQILGTRNTMEVTYQLQQKNLDTSSTGFGSARRVREFLYHPDEIKQLSIGKGIFMSKDDEYHTKISVNKPF